MVPSLRTVRRDWPSVCRFKSLLSLVPMVAATPFANCRSPVMVPPVLLTLPLSAVCCAVDTGLSASAVLLTLPSPKLVRAPGKLCTSLRLFEACSSPAPVKLSGRSVPSSSCDTCKNWLRISPHSFSSPPGTGNLGVVIPLHSLLYCLWYAFAGNFTIQTTRRTRASGRGRDAHHKPRR